MFQRPELLVHHCLGGRHTPCAPPASLSRWSPHRGARDHRDGRLRRRHHRRQRQQPPRRHERRRPDHRARRQRPRPRARGRRQRRRRRRPRPRLRRPGNDTVKGGDQGDLLARRRRQRHDRRRGRQGRPHRRRRQRHAQGPRRQRLDPRRHGRRQPRRRHARRRRPVLQGPHLRRPRQRHDLRRRRARPHRRRRRQRHQPRRRRQRPHERRPRRRHAVRRRRQRPDLRQRRRRHQLRRHGQRRPVGAGRRRRRRASAIRVGDSLDGGDGNDLFRTRDGEADKITCGPGNDKASSTTTTSSPTPAPGNPNGSCERVERRDLRAKGRQATKRPRQRGQVAVREQPRREGQAREAPSLSNDQDTRARALPLPSRRLRWTVRPRMMRGLTRSGGSAAISWRARMLVYARRVIERPPPPVTNPRRRSCATTSAPTARCRGAVPARRARLQPAAHEPLHPRPARRAARGLRALRAGLHAEDPASQRRLRARAGGQPPRARVERRRTSSGATATSAT